MKSNLTAISGAAVEHDLRARLEQELARRSGANPTYSLRALARDLDIDHSTLSQILRRKRPLTAATIDRLGARLGLGADAIAACVAHAARAASQRSGPAPEMRRLARDTANLIAAWY